MEKYEKKDLKEIYNSKNANLKEVYTTKNLRIEVYHVNNRDNINVHQDPEDYKKDIVLNYYVVSGSIEIAFLNEKTIVNAGEIISINTHETINIFAKEKSDLIAFISTNEPINAYIDDKGLQLLEMVKKAENDDPYVFGHNYRVGKYTTLLLQKYYYGKEICLIHYAAATHDIGKKNIDKRILNKPGKLSNEEFEEIKKHPIRSYEILLPILGEKYANIARWHHEKLDGSGYPDGLKDNEIPIESKAMAVADIFDALTTSRSYRKAYSFDEAISIMKEDANHNKIDINFVNDLVQLINEKVIVEGEDNKLIGENEAIKERIMNNEENKLNYDVLHLFNKE